LTTTPASSDLHLGAFTDHGPWTVDPWTMPWRDGIDERREAVRRQVPELIRRRRLPGWHALRVLAVLFRQLVPWFVLERRRGDTANALLAARLRLAFERLGPTFVKFGQLISSGQGLLPEAVVAEFKKLQDRVPQMPYETVKRIVEADLGRPVNVVFTEFEQAPLAAASIAQVHAATLPGGERIVVKVQREGISDTVRKDLRVMMWLARLLVGRIKTAAMANPPAYVELFAETLSEELDFRLEAQNLLDVAAVLAEVNQRQIVCPRPHPTLITSRVFVMERLYGYRIDDIEGIDAAGIDTAREMLRGLMTSFFEGAIIFGVFHGDLHAGNTLVTDEGRAALFDFGITGRFNEVKRVAVLKLLMSSATMNAKAQLFALADLGMFPEGTDLDAVMADFGIDPETGAMADTPTDTVEMVANMKLIVGKLLAYGVKLPKELMLLFKGVIYLDGAIQTLASDLNIGEEIGYVFSYLLKTHGEALTEALGFDLRLLGIDPSAMMSQMASMTGMEVGEDITFGEMRKMQATQQAEMRELLKKKKG
jgi:ubiquinone biosynthesis protein